MFSLKRIHGATVDEERIDGILDRFVDEVIDRERLRQRLLSGKRLRVKLGIDPTSRDLHLGRAVLLLKLRDFQELGHQIVLIIGNATGVIGDTSDKESERPMLDRAAVEENARTYLAQAGTLLAQRDTEVLRNASWLDKLTFSEIGALADLFSVADFTARDNVRRRLDSGKRVSLREVLYPIMQGYDSAAVHADVELGGTDQRFNMLAGRTIQAHEGQEPQDVLMTKLIPGTDGRKMSSSWGNTINVTDEPFDMYGKVMRVDDALLAEYFEACTRVSMDDVSRLLSGNPRDAKMRLAREIVALYHGEHDAARAEERFVDTFQKGEVPENVPTITVQRNDRPDDELVAKGIVTSKSEFQRLLNDGAVTNVETGARVNGPHFRVIAPCILKVGKRRFVRIIVS